METVDINRLELKYGDKLLDLGCGEGRHSIAVALQKTACVVGLDLDHGNLRTAKFKTDEVLGSDEATTWVRSDACNLPFPASTFDCVLLSEVLEHLPDVDGAFVEIQRVLRPEGQLAISVPRFYPEWICWRLSHEYHSVPGGHLRIFTEGEVIAHARAHGFVVRARHWAHALHTPYWWLQCALWSCRTSSRVLRLYHRFLVWDLMRRPRATRLLERLLNPILGKSVVLYLERDHA